MGLGGQLACKYVRSISELHAVLDASSISLVVTIKYVLIFAECPGDRIAPAERGCPTVVRAPAVLKRGIFYERTVAAW